MQNIRNGTFPINITGVPRIEIGHNTLNGSGKDGINYDSLKKNIEWQKKQLKKLE